MKSSKSKSVTFANIVLGGMVTVFILAIGYLFYKSNATQIPLNIKLLISLVAGLLFFIFTLLMRNSWKINVAVSILSVLLALYGVEFVLFAQHEIHLRRSNIDTRNKLEVLEDLRAEGIDAWPQVLAWLFVKSNGIPSDNNRIFPLGGISDKTIVYCNESGQYKIFESDEHGFNNPKGQYRKGNIQAALVGDSFTIGSCVKSGEDIAGRLRNKGISALNLGNGGNGPLIELALLKEYVEVVEPEIVLPICLVQFAQQSRML